MESENRCVDTKKSDKKAQIKQSMTPRERNRCSGEASEPSADWFNIIKINSQTYTLFLLH